jgi:chromosome segregation ATPase
MATKAKKVSKVDTVKEPKQRKSSLREKIAFLERQCEQLGLERNQFAIENERLKHEASQMLSVYNDLTDVNTKVHNKLNALQAELDARKNIRTWVLRRLGLR